MDIENGMNEIIRFRCTAEHRHMLDQLAQASGWTHSQVLRHLIEAATVRPAAVLVSVPAKTNGNGK